MKRIALLLLTAAAMSATTITTFDSRVGLVNTINSSTVAISAHPAWEPQHPANPGDPTDTSAIWISYMLTGYNDPEFQPFMGESPVVSIFDSFTSVAGTMLLNVWADDTAAVYLDGVMMADPKFTQGTCAAQPIGCMPQDVGALQSQVGEGTHTLTFSLYQTGHGADTFANPFGLLYTGAVVGNDSVTVISDVPEPGTFALVGAALMGVGFWRRKKRQSLSQKAS